MPNVGVNELYNKIWLDVCMTYGWSSISHSDKYRSLLCQFYKALCTGTLLSPGSVSGTNTLDSPRLQTNPDRNNILLTLFPNGTILDCSKVKAHTDDKINVIQKMKIAIGRVGKQFRLKRENFITSVFTPKMFSNVVLLKGSKIQVKI